MDRESCGTGGASVTVAGSPVRLRARMARCRCGSIPIAARALRAALALALAGPAVAAPVPLASWASAHVLAQATYFVGMVADDQSRTAASMDEDYRVDAAAYSVDSSIGAEAQVRMQMEVQGNGADQGRVSLLGSFGARNMLLGHMEVHSIGGPVADARGWFYRFQAGEDSLLRIHYDVERDAVSGGLDRFGYFITLDRALALRPEVGQQGVLDIDLEAGRTYELAISAALPIYYRFSGNALGGYSGVFDWSIVPADAPPPQTTPEPASAALTLGAGLAAVAARRRRRGPRG